MDQALEKTLFECIGSLCEYEATGVDDPHGWVQWISCVSHLQNDEYRDALEIAARLIADCSIQRWFLPLQILLIALQQTESATYVERWRRRLVDAAPCTGWQLLLTDLVLGKTDMANALSNAETEEQICQAYYYMGEHLLSIGKHKEAEESFSLGSTGPVSCIECNLSKSRIKALNVISQPAAQTNEFTVTTKHQFIPVAPTADELEKWLRRGSGENLLSSVSQLITGSTAADIALLADKHRLDSWKRIVNRLASSDISVHSTLEDTDHQWLPRDIRYAVADAFKEVFLERIENFGLVESHPSIGAFELISGYDLMRCSRLPRYQDIKNRLVQNDNLGANTSKYFISHRWLSQQHPDPSGVQLTLLKDKVLPHAYYWIDYSCMPQKPRTQDEESQFRTQLRWLPSFLFDMSVIVVRSADDNYFNRAWCFFESLAANVIGQDIQYIFEEKGQHDTYSNERQVLEQTLVNMDLPEQLGTTDPQDITIIKKLTQNVALFFKLRVVEHYMSLGQDISDQSLYFCEDPYYFVATCDFSDVMLWAFDMAKKYNRRLLEIFGNAGESNAFSEFVRHKDVSKEDRPYNMSKKVALDKTRLAWLVANRQRTDFKSRLFYKITAMIK